MVIMNMMIVMIMMIIVIVMIMMIMMILIMMFSSGLGQAGGEGEGLRGFLPGDINRWVPK